MSSCCPRIASCVHVLLIATCLHLPPVLWMCTQLKLGGLIGSSSGWELLQHLNGPRELEISMCKELRELPESMRSLTCLQKLDINWCDSLVLPEWLGELQSLQRYNRSPTNVQPPSINTKPHIPPRPLYILLTCPPPAA